MLVRHRRQMWGGHPGFSRLSVVELKYPSEGNSMRGGNSLIFLGLGEGRPVQRTFIKRKAIF